MTKRAGKKKKALRSSKPTTATNKRATPASPKTPGRVSAKKKPKKPAAPRVSRGKKTTGENPKNGALPLSSPESREGQIQRGLVALGLFEEGPHRRANIALAATAIRERWPSAAPGINGGLREVVEKLAFSSAAMGKTREVKRMLDCIRWMESQNQKDQADQIQRQDEQNRIDEARQLLGEMQALVSNASQNPAIFAALHRIEGLAGNASSLEPSGLGDGYVERGVEVISPSGNRESADY